MRACFGSFEKPRGKILRNYSVSLQDRSDSEMEGKPPSTYAPLSTISISSCCEWTRASHTHARRTFSPFDNGAPTNMTLEAAKGINEGLIQNGYIVVADTIEELAEGLGLPAETLKKTVERQNENYDAGVDPDFGKDAHRLSAIRTAPFYGVRTSGYMLCTLDGITINENFQAVDDNGKAIEGLYVTGVDSGSYYAHTYPNMSTGNCCGRSVTFGRMIGKALAAK